MVSAKSQCDSAIGIHLSPPSQIFLPPSSPCHPSRLSQSTGFEFPVSHSKFPLAIYLIYVNVYVSMLLSQVIPLLSPPLYPQFCSLCLHLYCCPASRFISTIFLDFIYIYTLIHDVCFSLPDLLISV